MDLIYITNDAFHARCANAAGVDRIMIDLEVNGKVERQGHLNTVISNHCLKDLDIIKPLLTKSNLLVRVNPIYENSQYEIDECIERGADILMLPMFKSKSEVNSFIELVSGRAKVCLLLETPQALARAPEILSTPGVDEVHVGLNDLHLGLGLSFMFELLSGGLVEYLSGISKANNVKFGFGGVARLNTGVLDSSLILLEHLRLNSSQVILSRDFNKLFTQESSSEKRLFEEVNKIRDFCQLYASEGERFFEENKRKLDGIVSGITQRKTL
jgi:hypothetical protein